MIFKMSASSVEIDNMCDYKSFLLGKSVETVFKSSLNKPRILLNTTLSALSLASPLKKFAFVKVVKNFNKGIFSFITHNLNFDLGVFCYEKDKKTIINFISGSGYALSPNVFSIINSAFLKLLDDERLDNEFLLNLKNKANIKYDYEKNIIDFNDVLNNKSGIISKCVIDFIKQKRKEIKKYTFNLKLICKDDNLKTILKKIFYDKKNSKFILTCYITENKSYFYYENKYINYKKLLRKNKGALLNNSKENEYEIFKYLIENNKEFALQNKEIYVIKNAYCFDLIFNIIYFYTLICENLTK